VTLPEEARTIPGEISVEPAAFWGVLEVVLVLDTALVLVVPPEPPHAPSSALARTTTPIEIEW
jgi:hypothetical protein